MNWLTNLFSRIAVWTAHQCGRASTFVGACVIVVLWAITGPFFGFSDAWQLVINTGTTIITFLMIFLLQHAQNRDSTAIQLKLDELIRVNQEARNRLLTLEDLTEAELETVKASFVKIAGEATVVAGLNEVRNDLKQAKGEIEEAEDKLAAAEVAVKEQHS